MDVLKKLTKEDIGKHFIRNKRIVDGCLTEYQNTQSQCVPHKLMNILSTGHLVFSKRIATRNINTLGYNYADEELFPTPVNDGEWLHCHEFDKYCAPDEFDNLIAEVLELKKSYDTEDNDSERSALRINISFKLGQAAGVLDEKVDEVE